MPSQADMEILVTGNVAGGVNSLKQVQTELGKTAISAQKTDSSLAKLASGATQFSNKAQAASTALSSIGGAAGGAAGNIASLGASFLGGGGLTMGINLAITALFSLGAALFSCKQKTDENTKAVELSISTYDKFLKEIEKTSEAAAKEAVKVSVLFSALSDSNLGLEHRATIIGQLNKLSPAYLGSLDKEKASYEEIAIAVQKYTDSLAISAEIKALLPQVEGYFQKLIKAQIELNQLRRFGTDDQNILGLPLAEFKRQEAELLKRIEGFKKQIQIAKKGLSFIAGGDLSLSDILFGKNDPEIKEKKVKKIKVKGPVEFFMTESKYNFNSNLSKPFEVKVKFKPVVSFSNAEFMKRIADEFAATTATVQGMAVDAFSSIGETIGDALGGGGNFFGKLFGGIFRALGAGLKQLGVYAITTSKLIVALKASIGTTLGIAGGIALIALGTLISAAASKITAPKFATGTRNFSGGSAIVGERGPELLTLPRGAAITPNNQLNAMQGGGGFIGNVSFPMNQFVIAFRKAEAAMNRNGTIASYT